MPSLEYILPDYDRVSQYLLNYFYEVILIKLDCILNNFTNVKVGKYNSKYNAA